MQSMVKVEVLS